MFQRESQKGGGYVCASKKKYPSGDQGGRTPDGELPSSDAIVRGGDIEKESVTLRGWGAF